MMTLPYLHLQVWLLRLKYKNLLQTSSDRALNGQQWLQNISSKLQIPAHERNIPLLHLSTLGQSLLCIKINFFSV